MDETAQIIFEMIRFPFPVIAAVNGPAIGAGCSGVITATTCTETGLLAGSWTYTVTPTMGANWLGAQSPHSGVVDTGPTTLTPRWSRRG